MADPQPGRSWAGSFVSPMPPFPPPQYRQGTPAPPPYPTFSHTPTPSPQSFSGPAQVYQQPQQHPSNFGDRFRGPPPPWTGYGFHGPPPSFGPQVPFPAGFPSRPMNSLPEMAILAPNTSGAPGTGWGQQRSSFGVSSSQNVSGVSLGQTFTAPPGIGSGNFRSTNGVQLSQDILGVTSSGQSTIVSQSSELAQVWNLKSGSAPLATPQVRGVASTTQSSLVANGGNADSGHVYQNHPRVNVVEHAMFQSREEKVVDLKEVLLQIRSLISKVEQAVEEIGSLAKIDLSSSNSFTGACPFDPAHKVVPEGLFQHFLRCPSSPKPHLNAQSLMDSLHYRYAKQGHISNAAATGALDNSRTLTAEVTSGSVSSSRAKFDIWGGKFFYDGASAVVQAPLTTVHPPPRNFPTLSVNEAPGRLSEESESTGAIEASSTRETSLSGDTFLLLPSRYYFMSKEIEAWEGLPSRSSSLVIEAAIGLGRVRKSAVIDWLLVHSPAHGIVIDSTLASHIYSLTRACFQEMHNEAYKLLDGTGYMPVVASTGESTKDDKHLPIGETSLPYLSEFERTAGVQTGPLKGGDLIACGRFCPQVQLVVCDRVFRSIDWLSAQLCLLYGSSESKNITLKLLKHLMVLSGRLLSSQLIGTLENSNGASRRSKVEDYRKDSKGFLQNHEKDRTGSLPFEPPVICDDIQSTELVAVGKSTSLFLELEAAVAAVNERAVVERYLRTPHLAKGLPKFQLIHEYEAAVQLAAAERMRRANYRPVLESDGLIWHRSQLEEKNKNKTREELLAEERDYKRRRMSYRGKRLKRTPTQVVRDIIEGHMEEIMAAGGIGCAVKQSGQPLPAALQQLSKADISVASNESSFAGAEQLRMPASNSLSVGAALSSLHGHEDCGGLHEHSSSHSHRQNSNEGFRLSSKEKRSIEPERYGGKETGEEKYRFKANDSIPRYSKFLMEVEDSEYSDYDGGRSSNVNNRSNSEDHRECSRISNVRPSSLEHRETERYSKKRSSGNDMYDSETHSDNRDYKGYQHDARVDQGKNSSSYERYGTDRARGGKGSRRHSDLSEDRQEETTSDLYQSERQSIGTPKSGY